jgi:hypothetical protein
MKRAIATAINWLRPGRDAGTKSACEAESLIELNEYQQEYPLDWGCYYDMVRQCYVWWISDPSSPDEEPLVGGLLSTNGNLDAEMEKAEYEIRSGLPSEAAA